MKKSTRRAEKPHGFLRRLDGRAHLPSVTTATGTVICSWDVSAASVASRGSMLRADDGTDYLKLRAGLRRLRAYRRPPGHRPRTRGCPLGGRIMADAPGWSAGERHTGRSAMIRWRATSPLPEGHAARAAGLLLGVVAGLLVGRAASHRALAGVHPHPPGHAVAGLWAAAFARRHPRYRHGLPRSGDSGSVPLGECSGLWCTAPLDREAAAKVSACRPRRDDDGSERRESSKPTPSSGACSSGGLSGCRRMSSVFGEFGLRLPPGSPPDRHHAAQAESRLFQVTRAQVAALEVTSAVLALAAG
jgi:hypothetical protein